MLVSRQTVNQYEDAAPVEVMTIAQNGLDWPQLMIKALAAVIALLVLFITVLVLQRRADKNAAGPWREERNASVPAADN